MTRKQRQIKNKTKKGGENYIEKIQQVKTIEDCKDGFTLCNEDLQKETIKKISLEDTIKEIYKKIENQDKKIENQDKKIENQDGQIQKLKENVLTLENSLFIRKLLIAINDIRMYISIVETETKNVYFSPLIVDLLEDIRTQRNNNSHYFYHDDQNITRRKIVIFKQLLDNTKYQDYFNVFETEFPGVLQELKQAIANLKKTKDKNGNDYLYYPSFTIAELNRIEYIVNIWWKY